VVGVSRIVPVNDFTPTVANCPAGELALSGGWTMSNGTVLESRRHGNGWDVIVSHDDNSTPPITLGVYVLCLRHAPAGAQVTERSASTTLSPQRYGQVSVPCTNGELAVGGGFTGYSLVVSALLADEAIPTAWTTSAYNYNPSASTTLWGFAECLTVSGAHRSVTLGTGVTLAPTSHAIAHAACPTGFLSGGGFTAYPNAGQGTPPGVYLDSAYPLNYGTSTWEAYVYNPWATTYQLASAAVCLSFG
jgi:hypothetical protein